jgi:hypothetical protein
MLSGQGERAIGFGDLRDGTHRVRPRSNTGKSQLSIGASSQGNHRFAGCVPAGNAPRREVTAAVARGFGIEMFRPAPGSVQDGMA